MHSKRNDYIILGYDLTKDRPAIYDEWANNVKNKELWEGHQEKGEIQLFSDPSDNHHLFFGYIMAKRTNPDEAMLCEISMEDMRRMKPYVDSKRVHTGLYRKITPPLIFKVYCFSEYK